MLHDMQGDINYYYLQGISDRRIRITPASPYDGRPEISVRMQIGVDLIDEAVQFRDFLVKRRTLNKRRIIARGRRSRRAWLPWPNTRRWGKHHKSRLSFLQYLLQQGIDVRI
jgi:hypothetical protein